ncbi:hypothetical protein H0X06_01215 [Candidatus Dependentiae bacterium]|nr:hypothetical protein [Candidatus Dependentiae bacterium]
MWFFLQKNLKDGLFGKLVALSGIVHIGAGILFFSLGRMMSSQHFAFNTQKSSIKMSMYSGVLGKTSLGLKNQEKKSGMLSVPGALRDAVEPQSGNLQNQVKNSKTLTLKKELLDQTNVEKNSVLKVQELKKPEHILPAQKDLVQKTSVEKPTDKKSSPQQAFPVKPALKKTESVSSKTLNVEKKESDSQPAPKQQEIPAFSSFKRAPSKKMNNDRAKKQEITKPAVPVKEPAKEFVSAQEHNTPLFSALKKKVKTTPEKTETVLHQRGSTVKETNNDNPSVLHSVPPPSLQGPELPLKSIQETASFVFTQAGTVESSFSDHDIVREIGHHYRRPPGFEEHEPFVFTFEINNRKAVHIGPRGKEPLVVYTAIKDAVLKATFSNIHYAKKIELSIT